MLRASSVKAWSSALVTSGNGLSKQKAERNVRLVKVTPQVSTLVSKIGAQDVLKAVEKRGRWGKQGFKAGIARAAVAEKVANVEEITLQPIKSISGKIKLPGSKSLSNRTLLLAALSEVWLDRNLSRHGLLITFSCMALNALRCHG